MQSELKWKGGVKTLAVVPPEDGGKTAGAAKNLRAGVGFVVDVDQVFDGGVGVALGAG